MANQAIDWGESAAEGDLDAWKALIGVFAVLAAVIGLMVGTVYVVARNIGDDLRERVGEAVSGAQEGASESGDNNYGYGGGN